MSEYGYLMHYGVKGMQWGVRNYQNPDGTLTDAGKRRYYNSDGSLTKKGIKEIPNPGYSKQQQYRDRSIYGEKGVRRINAQMNKGNMISGARSLEAKRVERRETAQKTIKKVVKIGVPIAATAIAVVGSLYVKSPQFRSTVNSGFSKANKAMNKVKNKVVKTELNENGKIYKKFGPFKKQVSFNSFKKKH